MPDPRRNLPGRACAHDPAPQGRPGGGERHREVQLGRAAADTDPLGGGRPDGAPVSAGSGPAGACGVSQNRRAVFPAPEATGGARKDPWFDRLASHKGARSGFHRCGEGLRHPTAILRTNLSAQCFREGSGVMGELGHPCVQRR